MELRFEGMKNKIEGPEKPTHANGLFALPISDYFSHRGQIRAPHAKGPSCGQLCRSMTRPTLHALNSGQLPTLQPPARRLPFPRSSSATRESMLGCFPESVHVREPDMKSSSRLLQSKIQSIKPCTSSPSKGAEAIDLTDRPSFDGTLSHVVSHRSAWMCKTRARNMHLRPLRVQQLRMGASQWRKPARDERATCTISPILCRLVQGQLALSRHLSPALPLRMPNRCDLDLILGALPRQHSKIDMSSRSILRPKL